MKKQFLRTMILLVLCASLTAVAFAADGAVKADIPFDFVVGKVTVPAGDYVISSQGIVGVMAIRPAAQGTAALIYANPVYKAEPAQETRLVFNKYGERYFLREVWSAGMIAGKQFQTSKAERELLASGPERVTVYVAAVLQ